MTLPSVIAIYSPSPESGKSTIARYLEENHDYERVAFAAPLKDWLAQLLVRYGYSEADAQRYAWDDKHVPLERIPGAPTARRLLQTLGTDWGRNLVHREIWTNLWILTVEPILRRGGRVFVEDLRFPSELETAKTPRLIWGGRTSAAWRLNCTQANWKAAASGVLEHASEGGLSSYGPQNWGAWITNDDTFDALYEQVEKALAFA